MKNTALVDFDGTIFSDGFLDIGILKNISKSYEQIIIVSNNSSLPQTSIELIVKNYSKYVLTPQIVARAIIQSSDIEYDVCCSETVLFYLKSKFYSFYQDIDNILKEISLNSSNLFLKESKLQRLGIIGKVDTFKLERFIKSCDKKNFILVAMNCDKFEQSLGIYKKSNLVGDLYDFKYQIGKTSRPYLQLLENYCEKFDFKPSIVFGDNYNSDGYLASSLGIKFKKIIFGKSKFSQLITC